MFMDTGFVKDNGYTAMINMHGWMFIDSYVDLRYKLLRTKTIINLSHHGIKAFETIGNDVVQTCSFVFKNTYIKDFFATYIRLTDVKDYVKKTTAFFDKEYYYYIKSQSFLLAEGVPFAYWVPQQFFENYRLGGVLTDFGVLTGTKNVTGNNDRFLRQFWEVDKNNISKSYWVPYSKGGFYNKYWGNITYVADWRKTAIYYYQNNKTSSTLDRKLWFMEGITYSAVTSRGTAFRYFPEGYMCDGAGPVINIRKPYIYKFLGFLNSKISNYYLSVINPTINLTKKDLRSIPYIFPTDNTIDNIVEKQMEIAKRDWSSGETTFEFVRNTLVQMSLHQSRITISDACGEYKNQIDHDYKTFEKNENEITNVYLNLYKLNGINIEYERRDFSVKDYDVNQEIIYLISYLIGVILGRYSLVEDGLIFAGGTFDPSRYGDNYVDEDGIIPIYSNLCNEDSLTHRILELIKQVYGKEHYRDNIDFIAESLGKKSNETSEETLNRYINDDFYSDHLKIYQKRPIYWMFSSGKASGFKCLIYMHRYDENTLAKINANYFQPATVYLRNQIAEVVRQSLAANDRDKLVLERKRLALEAQLYEAREYGLVLDYMANQYIPIDLDDGVKVNYAKFQGIEISTSHGKVTKDLLIPIKRGPHTDE